MSNAYEALARLRKANRLADVLEVFSGTPADAETIPAEGRRMTEQLAKVNAASDATWTLVADVMRTRVEVRRLTEVVIDPFEGIVAAR